MDAFSNVCGDCGYVVGSCACPQKAAARDCVLMPPTADCPVCDGSGRDPEHRVQCSECGGLGLVY